jgi:Family of unknown function (DUF6279)
MKFPAIFLGSDCAGAGARTPTAAGASSSTARRVLQIIGGLSVVLALQGCTAIKLAYNQAPELLHVYLDRYFDFNAAQSTQLKAELHKLQAWHRQTQLPLYIETLQKLQPQVLTNVSAKQACEVVADMQAKLGAVTTHIEPASAALAMTFGDAQWRQLEKKYAKDNAKFRDEYIDTPVAKMQGKRLKDAVERAERLYGNLGDAQLAVLGKIIERSSFDARQAYAERVRRQQDVLRTLKSLPTQAAQAPAQQMVRTLMQQALHSPDANYRRYNQITLEENCGGFAELHNATTVEQRKKAVETLKNYERDFKLLASQPAT